MRNKAVTLMLVLILGGVIFAFVSLARGSKAGNLISTTIFKQNFLQKAQPQGVLAPTTPAYNPPKEIKYDQSTDLQKELDLVAPEVLESDFKDL